jgi:hypothetical protein
VFCVWKTLFSKRMKQRPYPFARKAVQQTDTGHDGRDGQGGSPAAPPRHGSGDPRILLAWCVCAERVPDASLDRPDACVARVPNVVEGRAGERAALRRRRARLCRTAPSVSERLRDGCGADWPAGAVVLAVCAVGVAPAPPPPAAYARPGSRDRRVSLARQTTVPNSAHSCTVVVGAVGASWGCGRGC